MRKYQLIESLNQSLLDYQEVGVRVYWVGQTFLIVWRVENFSLYFVKGFFNLEGILCVASRCVLRGFYGRVRFYVINILSLFRLRVIYCLKRVSEVEIFVQVVFFVYVQS